MAAAAVGLLVGASACRPAPPPPGTPVNLLVIDVDTLRADRIGAQRDGASITPEIDALARRGTTFTAAFSHSGWTMPALVSSITGRLPLPIGNPQSVPARGPDDRDLPSILALYGYHTAAFWGSTLPGPMNDFFSHGFAEVHRNPRDTRPTDGLVDWLAAAPEPFFAWVHEVDLNDPDALPAPRGGWPYVAPADATPGMYRDIYQRLRATRGDAAATDAAVARYDAVVHAYDADVGRVVAALSDAGRDGRTVVVFTSDHGQEFVDHAVFDHGVLYDPVLRVPLIVVDPRRPGGRSVPTLVQGVDVAPTLLALAGAPVDAAMDGRSLVPLLDGGDGYAERPVLAITGPCHAALRTADAKVILRPAVSAERPGWRPAGNGVLVTLDDLGVAPPGCAGVPGPAVTPLAVELYDLVADPGEANNLVDARRDAATAAVRALVTLLDAQDARMAGQASAPLSAEQVRVLREQGYWSIVRGGDAAAAGATAPAPGLPAR